MISDKGICPTCGKPYTLKANGALRRHNSAFAKCFTEDQLPRELIRSVRIIAEKQGGRNDDSGGEDPEADISSMA